MVSAALRAPGSRKERIPPAPAGLRMLSRANSVASGGASGSRGSGACRGAACQEPCPGRASGTALPRSHASPRMKGSRAPQIAGSYDTASAGEELRAAGKDIFSAETQGIWRSLGGVQAMKPRHTQGLRGAMSSLSIPPPRPCFSQQAALPKPLPPSHSPGAFPLIRTRVIFCCAATRGQTCRWRTVQGINASGSRRLSILPLHGLTLRDSLGHSQLSSPAASPNAERAASPWGLSLFGRGCAGAG